MFLARYIVNQRNQESKDHESARSQDEYDDTVPVDELVAEERTGTQGFADHPEDGQRNRR